MDIAFGFGENWQRFLETEFSEERLKISQQHLLKVLGKSDLKGCTFLDIGCGSGIHSLAAFLSGAKSIVSTDVDPNSVAATTKMWELAGKPENWRVEHGSVLDKNYVSQLGTFDIVYSWGVLHHTGSMWEAIANATLPMHDTSIMYIALYADEVYHTPSPEYWIETKKKYNLASDQEKEDMEYDYAWTSLLKPIADRGRNPLLYIKNYKQSRGMEFWTDVRDWLGGYPMEFAKTRDMLDVGYDKLGLELVDIYSGAGNTEFVFKKQGQHTYFDDITASYETVPVTAEITHDEGFSYVFDLPEYEALADTDGLHYESRVMLLEDGKLVGFPHARFAWIKNQGEGRYAHWKDKMFFSASDNSDPRTNGRTYSLRIPSAR